VNLCLKQKEVGSSNLLNYRLVLLEKAQHLFIVIVNAVNHMSDDLSGTYDNIKESHNAGI